MLRDEPEGQCEPGRVRERPPGPHGDSPSPRGRAPPGRFLRGVKEHRRAGRPQDGSTEAEAPRPLRVRASPLAPASPRVRARGSPQAAPRFPAWAAREPGHTATRPQPHSSRRAGPLRSGPARLWRWPHLLLAHQHSGPAALRDGPPALHAPPRPCGRATVRGLRFPGLRGGRSGGCPTRSGPTCHRKAIDHSGASFRPVLLPAWTSRRA